MGMGDFPGVTGGPLGGRPPEGSAFDLLGPVVRNYLWYAATDRAEDDDSGSSELSTTSWNRAPLIPLSWTTLKQSWRLANLSAGQKIARTRFAWGFAGYTSLTVIPTAVMSQPMRMGLVTTIGPIATDSPPDPVTQYADQAPPAQRWLYMEERYPVVSSWDAYGRTISWKHSEAQEDTDSRAQVIAPAMSSGNTLNLYLVFRASTSWEVSGLASVWAWASVLIESP